MSIIIRLQNLPWSANSVDIRRYFSGLSIPEGGVHIVGGEMGDAFIAFSTDEDARLAMAKDGGKIKDMQIKLLLSSRTEMMRVIEQARQQNLVVQPQIIPAQPPILALPQPTRMLTPTMDSDRRRGRSPSPSSHRRSRDKSPSRDRRRSPDSRRSSKRDRSRSPSRSSRGSSRDMDRRGDRFKRDERRYDDSSRYRDDHRDDRRSSRDSPQEVKRYSDSDHGNSRSQLHAVEGFRETAPTVYEQLPNIITTSAYGYGGQQQALMGPKTYPAAAALFAFPTNEVAQSLSVEHLNLPKPAATPLIEPRSSTIASTYGHSQMTYAPPSYNDTTIISKEPPPVAPPNVEPPQEKPPPRRTRFEPEYVTPPKETVYPSPNPAQKTPLIETPRDSSPYNGERPASQEYGTSSRETWPHEMNERPENGPWNEKRQVLLNPPTKNGDFLQVVPMDLDPPDSSIQTSEKEPYRRPSENEPYHRPSEKEPYRRPDERLPQRGPPPYERNRPDQNRQEQPPAPYDRNRQDEPPAPYDRNRQDQPPAPFDRNRQDQPPASYDRNRQEQPPAPYDRKRQDQSPASFDRKRQDQPPAPYDRKRQEQPPAPYDRNRQNQAPPPFDRNNASPANEDIRREMPNRGPMLHKDHRGPPSLTVEVRRLPPDVRIDDIFDIFRGIPLVHSNVRIQSNAQGVEKVFVRFSNVADFEEALSRNSRLMHEGRCELIACPAAVFDAIPRPQKPRPKPKPREEDLCIQIRGLPFSCKEDDVVRFFDGLGILDLYVDMTSDGRGTGLGFVEFGTPEDFHAALAMNGKTIGHRYITISVGSKEMMALARGEDYVPVERPPPPPQMKGPPPIPHPVNQGRPQPPPCIAMRGLPECATNRHVAEFFSQVGVTPRAIHIMLRPDQTATGDAFAELAGPRDLNTALEMNGKLLMGKRISVVPIPYREMTEVVRPAPLPPPPTPGPLLRTPNEERPRRPLLPQGPSDVPFRERPRMEPPIRGGRPLLEPFNRMEAPGRPPFGRMRGPWPARPFGPDNRFPPPPPHERGVKDFGAPGCVVSINNLHFRAGLEELLDFFTGYMLTKDSIIRKYNENGQTTGEARVAFQNPREAQRAIRELNQKPIMGRPLTLSIL